MHKAHVEARRRAEGHSKRSTVSTLDTSTWTLSPVLQLRSRFEQREV